MISIGEMQEMLVEIADEFPRDLYRELNGSIILVPEARIDDKSRDGDLYILGEYTQSSSMGRYITIYYGSFKNVYGRLDRDSLRRQLKRTVRHELTHHV